MFGTMGRTSHMVCIQGWSRDSRGYIHFTGMCPKLIMLNVGRCVMFPSFLSTFSFQLSSIRKIEPKIPNSGSLTVGINQIQDKLARHQILNEINFWSAPFFSVFCLFDFFQLFPCIWISLHGPYVHQHHYATWNIVSHDHAILRWHIGGLIKSINHLRVTTTILMTISL